MIDDRDDYIERLMTQLEEWNMGLEELQSRVDRAEAEARSHREERIRELRRQYDAARVGFLTYQERKPESGEEGGASEWEEFREGMEEARRLLDEGLEEARREFDE